MNESMKKSLGYGARIGLCILLIFLGTQIAGFLASSRKPPATTTQVEKPILVDVMTAEKEDTTVLIEGWGELESRNRVDIAAEVSGRIVHIHPDLEKGNVIPAGEILFKIDPIDYRAALDEARAQVQQAKHSIELLKRQQELDRDRLVTLRRSSELAQAQYERVKRLHDEDGVTARSNVEEAERNANAALDQAQQLAQAVELYPIRIAEAERTLASMKARADVAEANLARTMRKAEFDARVEFVDLELQQFVSPGQRILTLADDSTLELSVPLDSRQVRDWMRFKSGETGESSPAVAWFGDPAPVEVTIFWTEDAEGHYRTGTLERIESFDQETRTVNVAITLDGAEAGASNGQGLPLVAGMFCRVEIPGKQVAGAVRLPTASVSYKNVGSNERVVYVARPTEEGGYRLASRDVRVSHSSDDWTYVAEGLEAGEIVVTSRLVNPLENSRLKLRHETEAEPVEEGEEEPEEKSQILPGGAAEGSDS